MRNAFSSPFRTTPEEPGVFSPASKRVRGKRKASFRPRSHAAAIRGSKIYRRARRSSPWPTTATLLFFFGCFLALHETAPEEARVACWRQRGGCHGGTHAPFKKAAFSVACRKRGARFQGVAARPFPSVSRCGTASKNSPREPQRGV